MNASFYYVLVVAIAVVAESPSRLIISPKSERGVTPLENTPLEQNSEMPATSLDHHTTATVKIENIIPYKSTLLRSSSSVSRLIKSFNSDYDPFFIQNMYMPADKRHKTIKVVSFRRNRLQPRMTLEDKELDSTVAEKQSPFNELPEFSIDLD